MTCGSFGIQYGFCLTDLYKIASYWWYNCITACRPTWMNRTYVHSVGAAIFPEYRSPNECLHACAWTVSNCIAAELEFQRDSMKACWLHVKEGTSAHLLNITYATPTIHQFSLVKKCHFVGRLIECPGLSIVWRDDVTFNCGNDASKRSKLGGIEI